jgi:hypothetical protein
VVTTQQKLGRRIEGAKGPRHKVISLRLNEERISLLERQNALASQLGRPVSLSEAAFLLIEDRADEADRDTTRHELRRTPTASLVRIRKRWASEHALAPAEWDLAHYVQMARRKTVRGLR